MLKVLLLVCPAALGSDCQPETARTYVSTDLHLEGDDLAACERLGEIETIGLVGRPTGVKPNETLDFVGADERLVVRCLEIP